VTVDTASASGTFGRFAVLAAERRLLVDGQPVALGSRAFDLLAALVARRDRVVPKDELIEVVWPGLVVEDNNLQVQVSALRKVLGTQAIATVPGRGYQFTVAAATADAAASGAAPPAEASRGPALPHAAPSGASARSRLLVADDNKVNRLLLCRSLELMGHDVASVDNGRSALGKLRAERFDLLLLDLEMPELDGFGLLEQRGTDAALREVPVIVTSSLEGVAAVARCIELGADDYLHKPVNAVLLKARVAATLERKRLRDRERELLARLVPDAATAVAGERTEATVLVARLCGLDATLAGQAAADTLELLGSWTALAIEALEGRGGRIYQLSGDAVSALFATGAARSAVAAAEELLELIAALGQAGLGVAVGVASGEVVTGYAGTASRGAFACVGAAAARAAQLAAPPAANGVRLDAATEQAAAAPR